MQFIIEFQADHLHKILEAVQREIATPHEMLNSIGLSLVNAGKQRHNQGLDPDGKPWKPLAASTLASGEKRKGGPLNKTGRMLETYFHNFISNDTLRVGFDGSHEGKLAAIHNSGSEPYLIKPLKGQALKFNGIVRRQVNHPGIPKRGLIGFPESDRELTRTVICDHLNNVLNRV